MAAGVLSAPGTEYGPCVAERCAECKGVGQKPVPGSNLTRTLPCEHCRGTGLDLCQHRDCAETRKIAETECAHCDEPIGFEAAYYRVRDLEEAGNQYASPVYAHAICEEERHA